MSTFGRRLYESFIRVNGWALTAVGAFVAILAFFYAASETIGIRWVVLGGAIVFVIVVALFDCASRSLADFVSPKVIQAREQPYLPDENPRILLLVQPVPWLGHDSVVSIYHNDDGFEVLYGVGSVFTIQQDGTVQIIILRELAAAVNLRNQILANEANALRKLLIKPTYPKPLLERL